VRSTNFPNWCPKSIWRMLVAAEKLSSERRWWRARWPLVCIPHRRLRRLKKENQSVWQTHPPLKHSSRLSPVTSFIQHNWQGWPLTHTYLHTWYRTHSVQSLLWSFILLVPLSSNHLSELYGFLKKKKGIFESGRVWNSSKPGKNTGRRNHRKCLDNEAAKRTRLLKKLL